MMKKLLALVLVCVLLTASFPFTFAMADDATPLKLFVNGVRVVLMDDEDNVQSCLVEDGEVYVPLAAFVDSLGGEYTYDEATGTITILLPSTDNSEAAPAPTENPRVDITPENIRDYFNISIKITNIKDTTQTVQGLPFNDVTADLVLTCYPIVACDCYNVSFKVTAQFNSGWVPDHLGWTTESFYVSLPSNGSYHATRDLRSYEIRYSFGLKESNAWFSVLGNSNTTGGIIESASGYIMLK